MRIWKEFKRGFKDAHMDAKLARREWWSEVGESFREAGHATRASWHKPVTAPLKFGLWTAPKAIVYDTPRGIAGGIKNSFNFVGGKARNAVLAVGAVGLGAAALNAIQHRTRVNTAAGLDAAEMGMGDDPDLASPPVMTAEMAQQQAQQGSMIPNTPLAMQQSAPAAEVPGGWVDRVRGNETEQRTAIPPVPQVAQAVGYENVVNATREAKAATPPVAAV